MPLYSYECNACGHQFETLVRSSDTPSCPSCGSVALTRQLSLIARPARGGGDTGGAEALPPACDGAGGCGMCQSRFD